MQCQVKQVPSELLLRTQKYCHSMFYKSFFKACTMGSGFNYLSAPGKRKLWGRLVAGFELMLILGGLKCHCGPMVKLGVTVVS